MKKFKWVYLFFALLLPIFLTFFLKYFGKSEFNIPVYYKNGTDSVSQHCGYTYKTPYTVPDSILIRLTDSEEKGVVVFTTDSSINTRKNFERISEEVNGSYDVAVLKDNSFTTQSMSCFLFLNKPWTTVLVDEQGRIRGYYAPATREETDRLIVEIKILLKQY